MYKSCIKSTSLRAAGAVVAVAAGLCSTAVLAAEPYVNVTVGGVLTPGVYGRIDLGNAPPPPVYNPQPMIIAPGRAVQAAPVYLYVPPGHQKDWGKHCQRYNACGQPVYFVRVDEREYKRHQHDRYEREDRHGHRDHERDHEREHGKKGKNRDRD